MNSNNLIKIALVADVSIFRDALRMLIEKDQKIKVVGEVCRISEATNLIVREKADLILIDLSETNRNELFAFPLQTLNKVPVLILTSLNETEMSQQCLRFGINGLVLKEKGADVLFKAIERVSAGDFWFDRAMMGKTIETLVREKQFLYENPKIGGQETITEREKQVVNLICKGMKNKNIAEKLFITETTVRHHLTSIFEKLGLASRLELVIYAFKHNLVKIPTLSDTSGSGATSNLST